MHTQSSTGAVVSAADFPEIRWHGSWIWCDPPARPGFGADSAPQPPKEMHGLFRKTYTLSQIPDRVPARITADSRYLLYCNGQEVFRGPIRSQPRIAPHLGGLAWAEGKIPTPHGLLSVRADPDCVQVDSPVPVVVELPGKEPVSLPAGKHVVP